MVTVNMMFLSRWPQSAQKGMWTVSALPKRSTGKMIGGNQRPISLRGSQINAADGEELNWANGIGLGRGLAGMRFQVEVRSG
ncbi:hypothetical protein GCM10022255_086750 [Dactylosporangium darangshiense]|uniref:Uncharacterized protein n=1 Tax=Dactylosporangium darangshiense TaxID=579108 RepID=A0ABP8DMX2_9ACTN